MSKADGFLILRRDDETGAIEMRLGENRSLKRFNRLRAGGAAAKLRVVPQLQHLRRVGVSERSILDHAKARSIIGGGGRRTETPTIGSGQRALRACVSRTRWATLSEVSPYLSNRP